MDIETIELPKQIANIASLAGEVKIWMKLSRT
jgi:hypothetical protein